jgi:hypothetical protein
MLRGVHGLVNVTDSAVTQAAGHWVILFAGHVVVDLVKELERLVQASRTIVRALHRRVVVDVLAVVDRRLLDLADRLVDLRDRDVLLATHRGIARAVLDEPARGAQVGQAPTNSKPESNNRDRNFMDTLPMLWIDLKGCRKLTNCQLVCRHGPFGATHADA